MPDRTIRWPGSWTARLDAPPRWLLLAAAAAAAWWLTPPLPTLDDGYIILHSADAWRTGRDAAYAAPPLTGVTSPAYLALVLVLQLAGQAIGLSGPAVLRAANAIGLAALFAGAWTLASDAGVRGWARLGVPVVGACSGHVVATLTNSLETGCATALVVWGIVCVRRRQPYRTALIAGLLPWTRPDLTPVAAVLVLAAAWDAVAPAPVSPPARPAAWAKATAPALTTLLLAAATAAPFVVWLRVDTGAWWPQTMDAKRLFFAEGCRPALFKGRFAWALIEDWLALTLPLAAGLAVAATDRLGRIGLATACGVLGVFAWTLPGGLAHNDFRYLTPVLAPWGILGFARLAARPGAVGSGASVLAALWIALSWPARDLDLRYAAELKDSAEWVGAHADAGATVLVHDAGALSVFTDRPLVDLVGLKTPSSVEAHASRTWQSCGADRATAIAAIARRSRARYVVIGEEWARYFHVAEALAGHGWRLTLVRGRPANARGYDVFRLDPPVASP